MDCLLEDVMINIFDYLYKDVVLSFFKKFMEIVCWC